MDCGSSKPRGGSKSPRLHSTQQTTFRYCRYFPRSRLQFTTGVISERGKFTLSERCSPHYLWRATANTNEIRTVSLWSDNGFPLETQSFSGNLCTPENGPHATLG